MSKDHDQDPTQNSNNVCACQVMHDRSLVCQQITPLLMMPCPTHTFHP